MNMYLHHRTTLSAICNITQEKNVAEYVANSKNLKHSNYYYHYLIG